MSIWDPKQTLDSLGAGKSGKKRSLRVADEIRNELSVLLLEKVRDPQLSGVTFTRVAVSDDLKYAKVYFTAKDKGKAVYHAGKALERAKGFMRSHLARTLNLRYTPVLQFFYDETAQKVEEVEKLFQEISREKKDNDDS